MKVSLFIGLLFAGLLFSHSGAARSGSMHAGGRSVIATFPFQTTVSVARQAAAISRLRARQAIADRITASGGLAGGFVDDGTDLLIGDAASGSGVRERVRTSRAPHMHIITVTPNETTAGQIQIMRGTSIEIVQVQ